MKGFFSILFFWVFIWANAQTHIAGYEYWFNNNFSARVQLDVTPSAQMNLNLNVATPGLPTGIHVLNFRAYDTQGRFSPTLSQFFYKAPESSITSRQIVSYEYWIDGDYANAFEVATTAQSQVTINEMFNLASTTTGMHTINMRFKDSSKLWSAPISQFFYKNPPTTSGNREIIAYKYWVDNDYENAVLVSTPAQQVLLLNEQIGLQSLSPGIHSFNIRFMDNSQSWSSPLVQFFYKMPQQAEAERKIVAYQYWLNNDIEGSTMVDVTPQQQLILTTPISLQGLGLGMHSFNIRFKDNSGLWSAIVSQFIYKIPALEGLNDNLITAYRYWIDNDIETVVQIELSEPLHEFGLIEDLDLSRIPKGERSIQFQFRDARGLWSLVTTDDFIKHSLPVADFDYTLTQLCDSTSIAFTDLSVDGEEYLWDFGDGNTSTEAEPVHVFYAEGTYQVSLTVTDILLGIDSTLTMNIFVPIKTVDTSVEQNGIVLSANALNATYQWLNCNNNFEPVAGAINKSFTPEVNGSYAVEVNQDGCVAVSECYQVTTVDVSEVVFAGKIRLFPNPTSGQINIDLGEYRKKVFFTVFDQFGRKISETKSDFGQVFTIFINQPPGVYLINIVTEGERASLKFVVK